MYIYIIHFSCLKLSSWFNLVICLIYDSYLFVLPYAEIQISLTKLPASWPGMDRSSNPGSDKMNWAIPNLIS